MADVKISALPAAGAADGAMEIAVNDAGTSRKVTLTQVGAAVGGGAVEAAHVSRGAAQSTSNNVWTPISWDTEVRDDGGLYDAGNPTRLTAPSTGWYTITGYVEWTPSSTGARRVRIYLNAATMVAWTSVNATGSGLSTALAISATVYLTAGDYVTIDANQTAGTLSVTGAAGAMVRVA